MFSLLRPILVAVALLPAICHAAESYVGKSSTVSTTKSQGIFELEVSGGRITGWVASSALQNNLRVAGTVNKAGQFELKSRSKRVKGKITGKLQGGKIRGSGRLSTRSEGVSQVTLQGSLKTLRAGEDPQYPWAGVSIVLPSPTKEDWDRNRFSYVIVHFTGIGKYFIIGDSRYRQKYNYDIYFAGKSGDRSYSDSAAYDTGVWQDPGHNYRFEMSGAFDTASHDDRVYYTIRGHDFTNELVVEQSSRSGRSGYYKGVRP